MSNIFELISWWISTKLVDFVGYNTLYSHITTIPCQKQRSFVLCVLVRKQENLYNITGRGLQKGYYVSCLCQFWQCAIELQHHSVYIRRSFGERRNIILKRDLTNVNLKIRCATIRECLVYNHEKDKLHNIIWNIVGSISRWSVLHLFCGLFNANILRLLGYCVLSWQFHKP